MQRKCLQAAVQTWALLTEMTWIAAHSPSPRVFPSPRKTWFRRQQACWAAFHVVLHPHTANPFPQAAVCCLMARTSAAPSAHWTRTLARTATCRSEVATSLRNAERDMTERLYSAQREGERGNLAVLKTSGDKSIDCSFKINI